MIEQEIRRQISRILDSIRYEAQSGVHTYYLCPFCDKARTRAGKCIGCLWEDYEGFVTELLSEQLNESRTTTDTTGED